MKTSKTVLTLAAVSGLVAGMALPVSAQTASNSADSQKQMSDKNNCKTKNSCKGKKAKKGAAAQGQSAGDKQMADKNSCKGKSGCNNSADTKKN
jgi:hypothetical protein